MPENLDVSALVCSGGEWGGLLFANPLTGRARDLFWEFRFDYEPIDRDDRDTSPSLTVDWAPLPGRAWHDMAGATIVAKSFGAPVEASVYYFEHFRYEHVDLAVLEQDGARLRVRAAVSGDVDRLGPARVEAEQWLTFTGIIVQLPDRPASVAEARRALEQHTNTAGLVGRDRGWNYRFAPGRTPASRGGG